MVKFIEPYFDEEEKKVEKSKQAPRKVTDEEILEHFKREGHAVIAPSGREALRVLTEHIGGGSIAIPDVICGVVYKGVKDNFSRVCLMDADETWNCVYDEHSADSDLLLYASLSGKRKEPPDRGSRQTIIADPAQCFDHVSGYEPECDYSLWSFNSPGKQMYAGAGAVLYSPRDSMKSLNFLPIEDWNKWLMLSQLQKADEIMDNRRRNGLALIEGLKDVGWLRLPDPADHVFTKFVVFLKQPERFYFPSGQMGRSPLIWKFMKYMGDRGVQVEETYIPLHHRFPAAFSDKRYKKFKCDHLWVEAITLPCRPNLTEWQVGHIIEAVKEFEEHIPEGIEEEANKKIFSQHTRANMAPSGKGYFLQLQELRIELIKKLGKDKKIVDLGCGTGEIMRPLVEAGYDVVGVDYSENLLKELREGWPDAPETCCADIRKLNFESNAFDLAYSFSTLYHIEGVHEALLEIGRILKPEGKAILELGNKNSLNEIECVKDPAGARCYNLSVEEMEQYLWAARLNITERRCFQLFPLYGSFWFNQAFRFYAEDMVEDRMVDELLSSAPVLWRYAFRHLLIVEKSDTYKPFQFDDNCNFDLLVSQEKVAAREEAKAIFANDPMKALGTMAALLKDAPGDVLTVLSLMDVFTSVEEVKFVEGVRKEIAEIAQPGYRQVCEKKAADSPKVSVVLPTYNQSAMLPAIVKSLLAQTYRDFELIIVDDGSLDGTKRMLESMQKENIKVIRHDENRRLPAALNTGFRAAEGEYLTWVSSDCYCAPFFLEALVGALDATPSAGLAYADFFLTDPFGRIVGRIANPNYDELSSLLVRNGGNAAFMYRREIARRVGPYNVDLEGAEDWDYWIRMRTMCEFVYVPEALYYYRLHVNSMQSSMPGKVNESISRMFYAIYGKGRIALDKVYPYIMVCEDRKRAAAVAAYDFARKLENPRVEVPGVRGSIMAAARNYEHFDSIKSDYRETEEVFKKAREAKLVYNFQ